MLDTSLMITAEFYKFIKNAALGASGSEDDNELLLDILSYLEVAYPLSSAEETIVKAGAPQFGHELDKVKSERIRKFFDIVHKGIYEDKLLENQFGKDFLYVNKNTLLSDDSRDELIGYTYSLMNIHNQAFEIPQDVAIYLNEKLNLQLNSPEQLKFENLTLEQKNKIKKFANDLNTKLKSRTIRLSDIEEQFIRGLKGLDNAYIKDLDTIKSIALYNYQPWQKVFTDPQIRFLTSVAYNLENLVKNNTLNREQNEALSQALSTTLINKDALIDKTLLTEDDLYYIREFAKDLGYNAALYLDFTPEQELFIDSLGHGLGLAVDRYKQEKEKSSGSLLNNYNPGKPINNQTTNLPVENTKISIPSNNTITQPSKNLNKIKQTSSFSGADAVISFLFPDSPALVVGTASTVTYSLYRQLAQVRTIGRQSSKGYARGGITYAGTIIFTVINESFIYELKKNVGYLGDLNYLRPDQLPPFDINISYGNEYGQTASMTIYGATFVDETMTISVEDMFTENILTFIARDVRHLKENEDINTISSVKFRGKDEILSRFIEVPKKAVEKPAINNQTQNSSEPNKNATSSNTSGQSNNNPNPTNKVDLPTTAKPSNSNKIKSSAPATNNTNQNKGTSTINKPKTNNGNITPPSVSTKKLVIVKLTIQDKYGTKIKGASVALKLNGVTINNGKGTGLTDKNGVVQFSNVDITTNKIFQVVVDAKTFSTLNQSLDVRSKENNKIIEEVFKIEKENEIKIKIQKNNYLTTTNKQLTEKGIDSFDDMPSVKITGSELMPLTITFNIKWRMMVVFKSGKNDTSNNNQIVVTQDYVSEASNILFGSYISSSFASIRLLNTKTKYTTDLMNSYVNFNLSTKFPYPINNSQVDASNYYQSSVINNPSILQELDKIAKRKSVPFNLYPTIEVSIIASIDEDSLMSALQEYYRGKSPVVPISKQDLPKGVVTFKFTINR